MGTHFNAAAFRASPFMAALTATDAIPENEKRAARRQAVVDRRGHAWKMEGRIRALFFHAQAANEDCMNARKSGGDGAAFCDHNSEVVRQMIDLLDEYVAIPSNGKTQASERLTFLRTLRGHTSAMGTFERWLPTYQACCAKIEAEQAAFTAATSKKRER